MDESERSTEETRWSRIREGDAAYLVQRYWQPIHRFLSTRLPPGLDPEDETQTFFLQFLERELAARADPGRGRFRTFVYHVARQFLLDRYRCAGRGREIPIPLDRGDRDDPSARDPRDEFDVCWIQSLLNAARREVKATCLERGRSDQYLAFHLTYFGEGTDLDWPQKRIAQRLGTSVGQVNNYVARSRELFGRVIRRLVAEYAPGSETEPEIADILTFLAARRFEGLPGSDLLTGVNDPDRPA